jgi:hypothetical protein
MKQIHLKKENLKDGRGLGERKPGSRRNRRTLDHKEEEAREERWNREKTVKRKPRKKEEKITREAREGWPLLTVETDHKWELKEYKWKF